MNLSAFGFDCPPVIETASYNAQMVAAAAACKVLLPPRGRRLPLLHPLLHTSYAQLVIQLAETPPAVASSPASGRSPPSPTLRHRGGQNGTLHSAPAANTLPLSAARCGKHLQHRTCKAVHIKAELIAL